jgi:hypothetical protein
MNTDLALINTDVGVTTIFQEFRDTAIIRADHSGNPNDGTAIVLDFMALWYKIFVESPMY